MAAHNGTYVRLPHSLLEVIMVTLVRNLTAFIIGLTATVGFYFLLFPYV